MTPNSYSNFEKAMKYIIFLHIRSLLISQQNKSGLKTFEILILCTVANMALNAYKLPRKLYFHEQFPFGAANELSLSPIKLTCLSIAFYEILKEFVFPLKFYENTNFFSLQKFEAAWQQF